MDVVDLRYLSIAAETGNLSRAAESLGIKPSTISRRIARLEDELGVTIFERGSFGIRLTAAGREVMVPVRRTLDGFNSVLQVGKSSGSGMNGQVRLGVRMPPVGDPLQPLLAAWREQHPDVVLTLHELNDNELSAALAERTLDAALVTTHTLRRGANTIPVYREPLVAALPHGHILASYDSLTWTLLRDQTLLIQGWDDSHSARAFYASRLGEGARFSSHPASKQSVMALVAAGFGITLATKSQSEVTFPGVVYKPILEDDAWLQVELAWRPTSEDAAVGRFVAFMRDEARSRKLL
ncbi:MAG: LysR family transcriptional regulator [Alphaproteobacteria bacterium 65-37]|jgi:DNA-binding transcriptional LysR family regulator|nr:MAG: LysR family transcriptional regulator [Alphaproteobacteria bacterium 65-37]